MKEEDKGAANPQIKPYIPVSPPIIYAKPLVLLISEVYTKKKGTVRQSKSNNIKQYSCSKNNVFPSLCNSMAAYTTFDLRNSASKFLITVFTIADFAVGGVILHIVGKAILNTYAEINELKKDYQKKKREEN